MSTTSNGDLANRICESLRTQLGTLFECQPAGDQVQIRTPFMFPDGDLIDLYYWETPQGQVVSDLGDTYGWLFVNGTHQELTDNQSQAYDEAYSIYGVERQGGRLLAHIGDGHLADAVVRMAQAITMISHTLDIGQQAALAIPGSTVSNKAMTETRIRTAIEKHNWDFRRNVRMAGERHSSWPVDFVVWTPQREAVLMSLYGRKHYGWQRRAIEHVFTVFSDLAPVLSKRIIPSEAISVIDDTDVIWANEPIEILREVSRVVHLSEPEELLAAIIGEEQ